MRKVKVIATREELDNSSCYLSSDVKDLMVSGQLFGVKNMAIIDGKEMLILDYTEKGRHFSPMIFGSFTEEVLNERTL